MTKINKEKEKLAPKDQLRLAEKRADQLTKIGLTVKKEVDWTNFYGIGKRCSGIY